MRIARQAWFEGQLDLDPRRLVFIDETGASTKMARLRGRAPRGERCRAAVPHGHWKTTTFTARLRLGGLVAPMVLDQAWTIDLLKEKRKIVSDDLVITIEDGQNSALDTRDISRGRDVGNVIVQRQSSGGLKDEVHDITFAFVFNAL